MSRLNGTICILAIIFLCVSPFYAKSGEEDLELSAYQFLLKNMPQSDLKTLPVGILKNTVDLALSARNQTKWGKTVPIDIFLNDVLPYAVLDEPREDWRPLFFERFMPLIENATSMIDAVQILNRDIWKPWNIVFKSNQTPDIMSPSQTIMNNHASCTGLSIFLAYACRAVGIPARVAGTPDWNTTDGGNHNWVEIWADGIWSFTGAHEYNEKGLNITWFYPQPAKNACCGYDHGIFATSFAAADGYFPLSWNPNVTSVPGVFRTDYYTRNSSEYVNSTSLPRTEQIRRNKILEDWIKFKKWEKPHA